jgi:hypothetical protein
LAHPFHNTALVFRKLGDGRDSEHWNMETAFKLESLWEIGKPLPKTNPRKSDWHGDTQSYRMMPYAEGRIISKAEAAKHKK